MQGLLTQIAQSDLTIDYRYKFDKAYRRKANKLTDSEKAEIERDEKIVEDKLIEVESSRKPINFFIPPIMKLLKKSKSTSASISNPFS